MARPTLANRLTIVLEVLGLCDHTQGCDLRVATFGFLVGTAGAITAATAKILQGVATPGLLHNVCSVGIALGWIVMVAGTTAALIGILIGWWNLLSGRK